MTFIMLLGCCVVLRETQFFIDRSAKNTFYLSAKIILSGSKVGNCVISRLAFILNMNFHFKRVFFYYYYFERNSIVMFWFFFYFPYLLFPNQFYSIVCNDIHCLRFISVLHWKLCFMVWICLIEIYMFSIFFVSCGSRLDVFFLFNFILFLQFII